MSALDSINNCLSRGYFVREVNLNTNQVTLARYRNPLFYDVANTVQYPVLASVCLAGTSILATTSAAFGAFLLLLTPAMCVRSRVVPDGGRVEHTPLGRRRFVLTYRREFLPPDARDMELRERAHEATNRFLYEYPASIMRINSDFYENVRPFQRDADTRSIALSPNSMQKFLTDHPPSYFSGYNLEKKKDS